MAFSNQLRFRCIHCGTCCCDPKTIVNTTYLDILRIKNGLDLTIKEMLDVIGFYIFEEELSQENLTKMVIPPIYTENGLAFVALRKLKSGVCIFYNNEKKRCSIYSLRPNFCRTFPFYFYYSNSIDEIQESELLIDYTNKALDYCEGISNISPIVNYDVWIDLGKEVLQELKQNEKFALRWNQNFKANKIKLTAEKYLTRVFNEDLLDEGDL